MEESSPLLPTAEEPIDAETDTVGEPQPKYAEAALELISESGFVCDCLAWLRSACKGLPFYKEHARLGYCVLHYPGHEKSADLKAALESKLDMRDFDFRGVWFSDAVDFSRFEFSADAYFSYATFTTDADFKSTTFSADAIFSYATFCADAAFSSVTFSSDASFSGATFNSDANFNGATFGSDASFSAATFRAPARFSNATFRAAADFISATFSGRSFFGSAVFNAVADFRSATFRTTARFNSATFCSSASFSSGMFSEDADFSSASFSADAAFFYARFNDANFNCSVFHAEASFSHASFNDSIHFFGSPTDRQLKDGTSLLAMALGIDPSLDFQHVRIEHPERIAFHTLDLRPHWFVNVDPRRFVFTDVSWEWERISIKREIAALKDKRVSSPIRLLAIACRQLAENAETNNRYEEASRFRYWAMDLARRTKWGGWRFWKTDWLHMIYWAVSGYGERIRNALGVLAAVWFVFVMLYTQVGFVQQTLQSANESASSVSEEAVTPASMTVEDRIGKPLEFSRALTYSLAVMSLQKPEPKPLTGTAQTLVLLETILGPVQAALLALAIRRKFMR